MVTVIDPLSLSGRKKHAAVSKTIFVSRQPMKLTHKIVDDYLSGTAILSDIALLPLARNRAVSPFQVIVTSHCLPTIVEMCCALKKMTDNIVFFPVPYSIEQDSLDKIQRMGITTYVETDLASHLNRLKSHLEESTCDSYLIECGGYLPLIWDELSAKAKRRILGAVEDTERGIRNYYRIEGQLPILDVARSTCKRFEDAIVGDSVVHSVEDRLRKVDIPLHGMQATVVGFGKIGQSVARALAGRRVRTGVYDIDAHKTLEAYNLGYRIDRRDNIFAGSRLIIGASGENSVTYRDLDLLDNMTILASASSRQVEFYDLLVRADEVHDLGANVSLYHYRKQNKSLLVINDGYPANFLHGSSMGARIDLVIASLVASLLYLRHEKNDGSKVNQLPALWQTKLAESWLSVWEHGNRYEF